MAYINMHGQSNLSESKQLQLEDFIKYNKIDIAHLQETETCETTFSNCSFLSTTFNLYSNNAANKYGTSSLVKCVYSVENLKCDIAGRAIVFDIGNITFGNFYGHSGTDGRSRANRDNLYGEIVPQLLTSRKKDGCVGGDLKCIIEKADATNHPEAKMSNCLKRVVKAFSMKDSYRTLYPKVKAFSRYYADTRGQGATRIDRQYHFGNLTIKEAKYLPLSFSDHHSFVVTISLPNSLSRIICPKARSSYRLSDEVIYDPEFQESLALKMLEWQDIRAFGMDTLHWWEVVVKPGIRKLGMVRGKQISKDCRAELNLLLIRQAYLNRKVKQGQTNNLQELTTVHGLMQSWYQKECEKVKVQSRASEFQDSEKVTMYHHKIHKKLVRKSAILKLQTPEVL